MALVGENKKHTQLVTASPRTSGHQILASESLVGLSTMWDLLNTLSLPVGPPVSLTAKWSSVLCQRLSPLTVPVLAKTVSVIYEATSGESSSNKRFQPSIALRDIYPLATAT